MMSRLLETAGVRNPTLKRHADVPVIPELNSLAVRTLISLFDERQGLFRRRVEAPPRGLSGKQVAATDSLIALLGLQRLAGSGAMVDLDIAAIQNAIFRDTAWVGTAGDLGLLSWVTAQCQADRLPQLFNDFDLEKVLDSCSDIRARNTRGLAWFLSGVSHAQAASPRSAFDLTDVAVKTYHLLLDNQSEYGLFRYSGAVGFIGKIISRRFGIFEDQMYAIYALTTFARAFDIDEPLESALMCANRVCDLQGDGGQWWSRYDTRRGCVASRYPVCSVHQAGIGPAALLALEEVTRQSFQAAIWRGLSWMSNNELGLDFREFDADLILGTIDRRAFSRACETACSYLHVPQNGTPTNLRVRRESRADHAGWLLYAFGNSGLPKVCVASTAIAAI